MLDKYFQDLGINGKLSGQQKYCAPGSMTSFFMDEGQVLRAIHVMDCCTSNKSIVD